MSDILPYGVETSLSPRAVMLYFVDLLLDRIGVRTVRFGLDTSPPPEGALVTNCPKIAFSLEGEHAMAVADRNGGRIAIRDQPGSIIYVVPMGWNLLEWVPKRHFVGVLYRRTYTRFVSGRSDGSGVRPLPEHQFHTSSPLSAAGQHLLRAMTILAHSEDPNPDHCLLMKALLIETRKQLINEGGLPSGRARTTWRRICEYIREQWQLPINRDTVAQAFRLHPSHVSRLFREQGNEGFAEYLRRVRMEKAAFFLTRYNLNVEEVSGRCGFSDAGYFHKVFKRVYGMTPSQYRSRRSEGVQDPFSATGVANASLQQQLHH